MIIRHLLSDAKPREDLAQDFVGGDFAGDGAEGGSRGAEVLRQEVGGEGAVEAVGDGGEGGGGVPEGGGVAGVGDERAGLGGRKDLFGQGGTEQIKPGAGLGGDDQRFCYNIFIVKQRNNVVQC